jgi:hypothetical protein
MTPDLSHRLGRALGQHVVTPAERATVVGAAQDAEVWTDLPPAVQALVEGIEGRPGPLAGMVSRAAGHDVTPGHDQLHHYWTRGEGLAKWIGSPTQWTTLEHLLEEHVPPGQAKRMAAAWVHEVTGNWPGSDAHRVAEGGKPRGHRIGPG